MTLFRRTGVLIGIGLGLGGSAGTRLLAQSDSGAAGRFVLHKFEAPIGEEHYQLGWRDSAHTLETSFEFTDRGQKVPLTAALRFDGELRVEHFEIKGRTSRQSTIDEAVDLAGDSALIRIDSTVHPERVPETAFPIAGYAPVAVQELMLRYWLRHGRPDTLAILPHGRVLITRRGEDRVGVDGRSRTLTRYSISGLIWGRETVWLDQDQRLAALVTLDAEFDHFEAVREGMTEALPFFVARAAGDATAALAELAETTATAGSGDFAITGVTLIDGSGRPPVTNATVVVRGGRIAAAGPGVKPPPGVAAIDGRGESVLPGLWDMHAHYEQVEWGPIYLAAGVTTVRDVGNEFDFIRNVRDAVQDGHGIGPRLLLAGVVDGDSPYAIGLERAGTVDQAEAMVRRYHDAGFRQMKIYSSMKPEIVRAIAREAHRLGMTVTGHIPEGMDGYQGVEAGMDQINHVTYVRAMMLPKAPPTPGGPPAVLDLKSPRAREALAFLKAHHTVVDPTIALYEMLLRPQAIPLSTLEPGAAKVAPELADPLSHTGARPADSARARVRFEELLSVVGALHRAGIPIVAGTDQSVPGHSLHRELELYVRAGFTPMEAIQAATIVPARAMGLAQESGTIAVGKRADLLVVAGNPLKQFGDLRRVRLVVAAGKRYLPGPLWESVGFRE